MLVYHLSLQLGIRASYSGQDLRHLGYGASLHDIGKLFVPQSISQFDSYANPIIGATIVVSGGYGANVSGTTDVNRYYTLAVKPINIEGLFALSFAVTSVYGNYNTIQSNITVAAHLIVPVANVFSGTTIAGQAGTMPNKVGSGTVITPSAVDQSFPLGSHLTQNPTQSQLAEPY